MARRLKAKHTSWWYSERAKKKHRHELDRKRHRKEMKKLDIQYRQHAVAQRLSQNIRKEKFTNLPVPMDFRIYSNAETVIEFYNNVEDKVKHGNPVYVDMANVGQLSIDSIMYYLALIRNLRHQGLSFSFKGNVPQNAKHRDLLRKCGFFRFVDLSIVSSLKRDSDTVSIREGDDTSPRIAQVFCDFVQGKFGVGRCETMPLYDSLIELMSNTRHHAYSFESNLRELKRWFIYAQYNKTDRYVRFIFLDTGFGIPATIQRTRAEQVRAFLVGLGVQRANDHPVIPSALEGASRSRTMETHRGKGLPSVQALVESRYFRDLAIISRKGLNSEMEKRDLSIPLKGTLFYWEMRWEDISVHDN